MQLRIINNIRNYSNLNIIIWIILTTVLFLVHSRGLMLNDEGYILQAAQRITQGEVIYKDFFIAYTPLSPIITAFGFILLGESIITARLIALAASLLTLIIIYKLAAMLTKNEILRWAPVLFFLVWGPMHINFSWPVVYSSLTGVATCYFLFCVKVKKNKNYYFWAGFSAVMTLLFKQNFGVASLAVLGVYFLINNKERRYIPVTSIGIGLPILVWGIYILLTNSTDAVIENFYFYFYQKLVVEGVDQTPFIYSGSALTSIFKLGFYLLPLTLSLIASIYTWREKKELIFIPLFCALYYLTGIRPVTDYVHYTPLLALSGLSIFLIILYSKRRYEKIAISLIFFGLIIIGVYASVFRAYYRWESPLISHIHLLDNEKMSVLVDNKYKKLITDMEEYVNAQTVKNEYIFINYYSPSLYFILERKNPTRFIYLSPNVVDYKYQIEIERNLVDKKVNVVITSYLLRNDKSHLSNYIRANYKLDKVMHNYMFWRKI